MVLGPEEGDRGEMVILNRKVSLCKGVLELKAQGCREDIVRGMGLAFRPKGLGVPGKAANEGDGDEKEMCAADAKRYRGLAARANNVGLDRPGLLFCAKEACRSMSKPWEKDWVLLKRIAWHLIHRPELVNDNKFDRPCDEGIVMYTDSGWCSCRATRRSTSGGVLCVGGHVVRTWSAAQGRVALSSAKPSLRHRAGWPRGLGRSAAAARLRLGPG